MVFAGLGLLDGSCMMVFAGLCLQEGVCRMVFSGRYLQNSYCKPCSKQFWLAQYILLIVLDDTDDCKRAVKTFGV